MLYLAPIVEGHGEFEALPVLLHRIAGTAPVPVPLRVNPPFRVKAGSFLNDAVYFHKYVAMAAAKAAAEGGVVLIVLDCEDDLPCELGPQLLSRACRVRPDVEMVVILAQREYESWFIAGIRSLRGLRGLPSDLEPPVRGQNIRDAKGWLGKYMDVPYDPVCHQLEFTRALDIGQARSNQSFDRFVRRLHDLIGGRSSGD